MNLPRRAKKIHQMSQAIAAERVRMFKLKDDARTNLAYAIMFAGGAWVYSDFGRTGVALACGYYCLTALVAYLQFRRAKKEAV